MNKLNRLLAWAHAELKTAQKAIDDYKSGTPTREAYYDGRCEALEEMIEQIQGLKENP